MVSAAQRAGTRSSGYCRVVVLSLEARQNLVNFSDGLTVYPPCQPLQAPEAAYQLPIKWPREIL